MPGRAERANQSQRIRQQVAAEAARILATEGQRNYLLAKQKAASRLGLAGRSGLPSNSEVELELKRYQAMYGGSDRIACLLQLRQAALAAMKFFHRFRPRLVGPVLEGTADQHSRIALQLFCDHSEEVIAFLHRNAISFSQEQRRIRWHDNTMRDLELVVIDADGNTFELAMMAGSRWRQAPPDPISGASQRRAGLAEVEQLIAQQAHTN